ncbi:MAG TPA: hypothetical protein VML36_04960 [Nitrospiria bacterium]|nr:hypothetical protein [Nitrospiria bacterium]
MTRPVATRRARSRHRTGSAAQTPSIVERFTTRVRRERYAAARRPSAPAGRRLASLSLVSGHGERARRGSRQQGRIDFAIGVLIGLLLVAGLLLMAGCRLSASTAAEPQVGTDYVVFLDLSMSVRADDRALMKSALTEQIIPTLVAGDHLVIASITDRTMTGFHPLVDESLPPTPDFNGWTDNLLKYKKQVNDVEMNVPKIKERIDREISATLDRPQGSMQTDVFSSLLLAEKLFHNESRRKVLVLMSDMIEDYAPYRFERVAWTPDATGNILRGLEKDEMIPNLSGVCVYVAGASANSPLQAEQISAFWQAYFKRAGADMDMSRYAHVLLHWPPATACGF